MLGGEEQSTNDVISAAYVSYKCILLAGTLLGTKT